MRHIRGLVFFGLCAAMIPPVAEAAALPEPPQAQAIAALHQAREVFAKDFAQKVLAIVQDPKKSYADRKDILRQAFANSVDIDWIARFVLGKSWNSATPRQQQVYAALYRKYLTDTYVSHFAEDPSKRIRDIRILGVNDIDRSDFTVRTKMMLADMENLDVNYLVRQKAGAYKVLDIVIENVSLIQTHRAEFDSLAAMQGVDSVIAELRDMTSGKQGGERLLSMK